MNTYNLRLELYWQRHYLKLTCVDLADKYSLTHQAISAHVKAAGDNLQIKEACVYRMVHSHKHFEDSFV